MIQQFIFSGWTSFHQGFGEIVMLLLFLKVVVFLTQGVHYTPVRLIKSTLIKAFQSLPGVEVVVAEGDERAGRWRKSAMEMVWHMFAGCFVGNSL